MELFKIWQRGDTNQLQRYDQKCGKLCYNRPKFTRLSLCYLGLNFNETSLRGLRGVKLYNHQSCNCLKKYPTDMRWPLKWICGQMEVATIRLQKLTLIQPQKGAGPCDDYICASTMLKITLHLKIKKLSMNSPRDFNSVLDTINHY